MTDTTDNKKLRDLFKYQLRSYVSHQDGRDSLAPSLVFADADYEVGDGTCGLHSDAKSANEPAIVFVRADSLIDALAERDRYKARAERAEDRIKDWIELASHVSIEAGVCCCGDDMENHSNPMDCGHSPVDHGSYMADLLVEDARATLAQIEAEPAEPRQPKVKPLQWVKDGDRHHAGYYVIEDISYGQREVRRLLRASFNSTHVADFAGHKPLEQAKAAAQADYERRILSALAEGDNQ